VSRPESVDRADPIGVFLEAACDTGEACLRLAIVRRHMIADRTLSARILRRHKDEMTTAPGQLVIQLAAEFEPSLIEDGFVQASLGPNLLARHLDGTDCRL
jgi:hypothetical protein